MRQELASFFAQGQTEQQKSEIAGRKDEYLGAISAVFLCS